MACCIRGNLLSAGVLRQICGSPGRVDWAVGHCPGQEPQPLQHGSHRASPPLLEVHATERSLHVFILIAKALLNSDSSAGLFVGDFANRQLSTGSVL